MASYRLRPEVRVTGVEPAVAGWNDICARVRAALVEHGLGTSPEDSVSPCADSRGVILAIECYPGVNEDELLAGLVEPLSPDLVIHADDYAQSDARIQERIADCITDDRVFGVMSHFTVDQFYEEDEVARGRGEIAAAHGLVVVWGTGTAVIAPDPDVLVYADLTRWEIQLRQRHGMRNWKCDNADEDALRKFKRGYFFEWRMADREKLRLLPRIDFLLDTNVAGEPKMADGASFRSAMSQVARQPFRTVPYFDASVWGGHWMQERFGLDPDAPNFGWAFDGVPEENGLILEMGGVRLEVPAMDVVLAEPDALLGPRVRARFGREFPIRFDFLDTMGGQNLSLQVHPLTEYAQDRFGIPYTQDESYYILEASTDSCVYLGVRTGVDKGGMIGALREANAGAGAGFDDGRYVNRIPVSRHDHVSIPAGTIHGAGAGTVVLEISATPYIFTFKLWDWGRIGLDGIARPVHIDHGEANIRFERDTEFVLDQLVDRADAPHENLSTQPGVTTERTGLHELEFIETRRHRFSSCVELDCHGSVNMLNLVEGEAAYVASLDGSFEDFEVGFGETFIVPESVGAYRIENAGAAGSRATVVQAYVRGSERTA